MADIIKPVPGGSDYVPPPNIDISYSKGPKVLYGDPDVFQLILNDPQTDDDDEWGRTEEIAFMMITDELNNLHSDIYGYSSIKGVVDKVQILVNYFVGLEAGNFLAPQNAVLTIGSTQLSNGALSLATGTSFTPSLLSMDSGTITLAPDPDLSEASAILSAITSPTQYMAIELDGSTEGGVYFSFNGTRLYSFGNVSDGFLINVELIAPSANISGDFTCGTLATTTIAGTTLTFPTSTSAPYLISALSNYISGTAGGTSDSGDVLTLTSNNIEFYIKTPNPVVGYSNNLVLFYSVGVALPYPITLNINSYVSINKDLTITGDAGGHAIINFLTSTQTSILDVYDDSGTNWLITGATTFSFGDLQGTSNGVSLYNNRSGLFGIEIGTFGPPQIDLKILAKATTIAEHLPDNLVTGLEFSQVGVGNNVTLNNLGMYLIQGESPWDYLSLSYNNIAQYTDATLNFSINNTGVGTGQNSMKWKTYSFPGTAFPSAPFAGYVVDLPAETADITNKTYCAIVSVISSGGSAFSPSWKTKYDVGYFYNSSHTCMSLDFEADTGSPIGGDSTTVRVTIFYSSTNID